MCLTSLIPLIIANWTGPCSSTREAADAWLQAFDESIIGRYKCGWDCTPRAKSNIYDCLVEFVIAKLRPHLTNWAELRLLKTVYLYRYFWYSLTMEKFKRCNFVFPFPILTYHGKWKKWLTSTDYSCHLSNDSIHTVTDEMKNDDDRKTPAWIWKWNCTSACPFSVKIRNIVQFSSALMSLYTLSQHILTNTLVHVLRVKRVT